jgi:hypothetical protein
VRRLARRRATRAAIAVADSIWCITFFGRFTALLLRWRIAICGRCNDRGPGGLLGGVPGVFPFGGVPLGASPAGCLPLTFIPGGFPVRRLSVGGLPLVFDPGGLSLGRLADNGPAVGRTAGLARVSSRGATPGSTPRVGPFSAVGGSPEQSLSVPHIGPSSVAGASSEKSAASVPSAGCPWAGPAVVAWGAGGAEWDKRHSGAVAAFAEAGSRCCKTLFGRFTALVVRWRFAIFGGLPLRRFADKGPAAGGTAGPAGA